MLTALRTILRTAARTLGVERAATAASIEEMWTEVVGGAAAAHSRVVGIRGTVLLAEAEVGPWTQEISAQRGRYLDEINRRLGNRVLTEIRVRQTSAPFPTGVGAAAGTGVNPGAVAGRASGDERHGTELDEKGLSPEELTAVDQAVAEIRDPELREGARRAMMSQLRWRKRQPPEEGTAMDRRASGNEGDVRTSGR